MSELVGQSRQIGRFGTTAQIERAAAVLDDAKRRLYAIRAEPPEEPTDEAGAEPGPATETAPVEGGAS